MNETLSADLKQYALDNGIDLFGITSAKPFVIQKNGGTITVDPGRLLNDAKAIIVMGYYNKEKEATVLNEPSKPRGRYSAYSVRTHVPMLIYCLTLMKNFLKEKGYKVIFDYEPREPVIPFKMAAVRAGLGHYGKNSIVITEEYGSYVHFVPLVTDAPLQYEEFPIYETKCGKCEVCIKSCPTSAIYAPFKLDRNLCITNWLWGEFVPVDLREKQENRLFGCGECIRACPRNRKLKPREIYPVQLENVSDNPELIPLVNEKEEYIRKAIASFPLTAGIDAIRGNAIIGLGNIADKSSLEALEMSLRSIEPKIRSYSSWAMGRIGGNKAKEILEAALLAENAPGVIKEIQYSLHCCKK